MNETSAATRSVVVEREFPHPPEKIWRALTQPHLIEEWLMKNDFKPVVGHHFNLRAAPQPGWNGVIDCEVLVIEPNRTLSYTWNSGEAELAIKSVVTLSLTPKGAGTLLRMEQTGFRQDQQQNYQGAKYGWQHFFAKLEQVAARTD
ncbi:MAG TPA: SRPBCC domain-containing protein [Xanthobacteraceae bacterium]|nr:SRPBCC domain-containing protein [Xanthobacteraceae bacterium]